MKEPHSGALLALLAGAGTRIVRERFRNEPLRLRSASLVVEKVRVLPETIVAEFLARGPMGISARGEALITVESVGDEQSVLNVELTSTSRTVEQLLSMMLPTMMPRIEALLLERGIAGVTVRGERIVVEHEALMHSILDR